MSDPDGLLRWEEVEAWLAAAWLDRQAAAACLAADPPLATPAAFHCQQATEKLLKGFLIDAGQPFRKTHDLAELIDAASWLYPEIVELAAGMEDWTVWAVMARYPRPGGVAEPQPGTDLRRAIADIDAVIRRRAEAGRSTS